MIAKDAAQTAQRETLKEKQEAERLLVKSEGLLYASHLSLAQMSFADKNAVQALATLPSLDELRGKIIGLVQAPATKIAGVLAAPGGQLARVINAYATKDAA